MLLKCFTECAWGRVSGEQAVRKENRETETKTLDAGRNPRKHMIESLNTDTITANEVSSSVYF
jgi:hypothetical protein